MTIKNGLVVFPNQNQQLDLPRTLVPDKSKPELNVNRQHIVYITDVDPGVKGKYNEVYGSKLSHPKKRNSLSDMTKKDKKNSEHKSVCFYYYFWAFMSLYGILWTTLCWIWISSMPEVCLI